MGLIWRDHDVFIEFPVNNNKNLFCSHILLCNILTVILRPNFEEPLDTAKQLVEQNITLYIGPGGEGSKQFLLESSIPEYNILGENMIITDDWDHFKNMTKHDVIGAGTHAQMVGLLWSSERALGRWHRSHERVTGDNPYAGYLTSKKWHLNEESRCRVRNNKLTPLIRIF